MILSNVNIGTGPSAGDGDPLRTAFTIINNNFQTIENNVNALTNSVTSVAGRTGNVILTVNDIVGLSTGYAVNGNVTAANVGMKGYVDSKITANIALLVNAAPSTLDTIRELADAIGDDPNFAVNVALSVSSANTKMRNYVDGQITAANTASATANVGMTGYVNQANTTMNGYVDGQITAANAGVTSANLGLKGYVDLANTIQSAQVGAANLAITAANLGMKGYVDSLTYSNVQVDTYLPTYSGNIAANIAKAGYIWRFSSDGNLTLPRQLFLPNGTVLKDTPGDAVGLGNGAGYNTQGDQAVAIGREAAEITQGARSVAVGVRAGQNSQGISAVAIGDTAGNISQGNYATAVGINAGRSNQGVNSTAIGNGAGETSQGIDTVAVGVAAGNDSQGNYATAVGVNAGQISQGVNSTAIGNGAGQTSQGLDAVAVGVAAGNGSQGLRAVSVGAEAGQTAQGNTAVAIGYKAGKTNQAANSIAINASLSMLYANVSGLYINPVRQDDSNVANIVYYNTLTKEMTYGPAAGSSYGNVQVEVFTNLSNYAYNANVTAANVGMKGYVDSLTYSNVQVATYLPTYTGNLTAGNVTVTGNLRLPNQYNNYVIVGGGGPGFSVDSIPSYWISGGISTYGLKVNVADFERANIAGNLYVNGFITFNDQTTQTSAYSNVQVAVFTNLSTYAYSANVTAANVGLKGYVDSLTYADSDVQDYLNSLYTINIGYSNRSGQGEKSIAIGASTAYLDQGANCIAIGTSAGAIRQSNRDYGFFGNVGGAIAIGGGAGQYGQGYHSVSIGYYPSNVYPTGQLTQGNGAVSLGAYAGAVEQGENAVAIGYRAGISSQYPNSIVINASGTDLNANTSSLYISPVRQDDTNVANIIYYNTSTKEMTYGPASGSSYSNVQVATYLPTHTGNVAAGNVKVSTAYRFETGNVTITNESGYVSLNPDTVYSGTAGVKIGGSGFLLGPNGARNITLNYGSTSGAVGLQGNVTIGSAGSGNLFVLGNVIARDITGGNILATGTSGVVGFNGGGFVQQATSNATQVTSNTTSGNIQLMSIDIGAHAVHTVTFACNKLTTNDLLLIKHVSGGITSVYVDAYVASDGLAVIWLRDITGSGTGAFTPMLKYAIVRAPSA